MGTSLPSCLKDGRPAQIGDISHGLDTFDLADKPTSLAYPFGLYLEYVLLERTRFWAVVTIPTPSGFVRNNFAPGLAVALAFHLFLPCL